MKVFLNHIDSKRFHSFYHELLKEPCVEYILRNKNKTQDGGTPGPAFTLGKLFVNLFGFPTINYVGKTNSDIIHSCQSIPLSNKPYVVDFEHVSAFGGWNHKRIHSSLFKFMLKKFFESKRCKKILPWTKAAAHSLTNLIGEKGIKDKIEVVYPAISVKDINPKKKKGDKFVFLFVAYNFLRKGGEEALKAFTRLSKEEKNTEFWIISNQITGNISYDKNKVKFFGLKDKKEIYEKFYPEARVFLYPTYNDSFGMVFLEAMAFGLPIITIEDFASEELIINGKNGFVAKGYKKRWYDENYQTREGSNRFEIVAGWRTEEEKERVAVDLYTKMKQLVKNKKQINEIGKNNILETTKGRFSIARRNEKLKKIYSECLN
jgi:glycosyltransferase involved in cell wall biosynthesis